MAESGAIPPGVLYRVERDGAATPVLSGLNISNGICWSPDGRRMYLADSARGKLYAAPYNRFVGALSRFELIAKFTGESPDGAVTDAAGNYWTALWAGPASPPTHQTGGRSLPSPSMPRNQVAPPSAAPIAT